MKHYETNSLTCVEDSLKDAIDKRLALQGRGIHVMHTERSIPKLAIEVDRLLTDKAIGRWSYSAEWFITKKFTGILVSKWNGDNIYNKQVLIVPSALISKERLIKYLESFAFNKTKPIKVAFKKSDTSVCVFTTEHINAY